MPSVRPATCRRSGNIWGYDVNPLETYQNEARRAARKFEDVNAACPYPFGTIAGQVFAKEFARERALMASAHKSESPRTSSGAQGA